MRVPSRRNAPFSRNLVAGLALCAWACGSPTAPTRADATITASGTGAGGFAFQVAGPGRTTVTLTWTNPSGRSVQFDLRLVESTLIACVTQNGLANTPCVDWTAVPTGPTSAVINADINTPSGGLTFQTVFFGLDAHPSPQVAAPWTVTVTGPGVTCGAYPGDPTSQACH